MPSPRHAPMRTTSGMVMQAGLPKSPVPDALETTFLVRGVVTAVYVLDDPAHPYASSQPCACYCDVLVYTKLSGGRTWPLQHVLVSQETAGIQAGSVRLPKATSQSLTGSDLNPRADIDFAALDGDHVLVGFIDHSRQLPVVLRYLPHPHADVGLSATLPPGRRTKLRLVDGTPDLRKHQGTYWGVDSAGNFVANAAAACGGQVAPTGAEVPGSPTGSVTLTAGALGSQTSRVAAASPTGEVELAKAVLSALGYSIAFPAGPGAFSVVGAAGPLFAVAAPGGAGGPTAGLKVGSGGTPVARASSVADALNAILVWLRTHSHPASGAPPAQLTTLPAPPSAGDLGAKGLDLPG